MQQPNAIPPKLPDGILLGYQRDWVEDTSSTKVLAKSRRIGGSWGEAADDTLYAATHGRNGGDVIYIAYKMEIAREFIDDCKMWAEVYNLAASDVDEGIYDDDGKDILTYEIRFASGYKIQALTSSPRSLRGKGKNRPRVVIDEAAFHDNLRALLKSAIALKIWGAHLRILSSHNGVDNPFNEFIEEIRTGKRPGTVHSCDFRQAIADGLYKRICTYLNIEWTQAGEEQFVADLIKEYGEDADEELFCIPAQGEGNFFTRPMIKNVMRPDIPILSWAQKTEWEELPDHLRHAECQAWCEEHLAPLTADLDPDRTHWFGEDFARNQNLTVIWPIHEKPDTNLRIPFSVELFNIPFRQQEQILFYILDRLPMFAGGAMDARGNGQALAEYAMQRYGSDRIHRIMLTDKWYGQHFPIYKATVADRAIEIPQSADVLDDHRAVKKIRGVPKIADTQKAEGKTKRKRHGDSAIAGLMAVYVVNEIQFGGVIEFESTGRRRSGTRLGGYLNG